MVEMKGINQHITCKLCAGYFIDATTITECLHTCMYSTPRVVHVHLDRIWQTDTKLEVLSLDSLATTWHDGILYTPYRKQLKEVETMH